MAIPEHQIRVIRELEEISAFGNSVSSALDDMKDRIKKLKSFVDDPQSRFASLDPAEQNRLKSQYFSMVLCVDTLVKLLHNHDQLPGYLRMLEERIAAF